MISQLNAMQMLVGAGDQSRPLQPNPLPNYHECAREMFIKRMGGVRNMFLVAPKDFLMCHVHDDQVFVFYLFGGKAGVVNEPIDMFPSDTLITQFKMILAG